MERKGFKLGKFLISSPNFYQSGNLHFAFRYLGTKSVSICNSPEKMKLELGNINGLDEAMNLYKNMAGTRPFPRIQHFNQLLSHLVNLKEYSASILLFNDICNLGVSVTEYTMSIAINSYCLSNRIDYGFSVLAMFFKRGCVPDSVTFNTLLKGLFRENRISEAQELFRKIVREGLCELTVVTYGTVIDGLCKSGNTAVAIELLRVMEKGSCCKPKINVYNMVIDSLCKNRGIESALNLFRETKEKGVAPDVSTYNSLLCALCNLSEWEQVKMLVKEMADYKIYQDRVTFTIIIDSLCKEGLVDEAEDVLRIMLQRNVAPDVVCYSALMDGYCLQGRVDKARNVFDKMPSKNIAPNVVSFSILINAYCKQMKKINEALHLFRDMQRKGFEPDVAAYNTLLHGLFHGGRYSCAMKLFDELQTVGLKPNFYTYCNLLDGLCMNRQNERALLLLEQLEQKKNEYLHIAYYSIVMDGFFKAKEVDKARVIFSNLPCKGLEPDVKTYTIMINGCCQNGLLLEAKDLLVKMEEARVLPNEVTYNAIIRGNLLSGEYDDAAKFFEEMSDRGFSPDPSTFGVMLDLVGTKEQSPTVVLKMIQKLAPNTLKNRPEL
ncbi:hypothetical protein ABFS83_06G083600 [Erythranthe nasuta]